MYKSNDTSALRNKARQLKNKSKEVLYETSDYIGQKMEQGVETMNENRFLKRYNLDDIFEDYAYDFGDDYDAVKAKIVEKLKQEEKEVKRRVDEETTKIYLQKRTRELADKIQARIY